MRGVRLVDTTRSPDCGNAAHLLIRDENDEKYELLTAYKLENRFPPGPGIVEFTYHRLRTLKPMNRSTYIYGGYRKVKSRQEHSDVVEAVRKEILEPSGRQDAGGHSRSTTRVRHGPNS